MTRLCELAVMHLVLQEAGKLLCLKWLPQDPSPELTADGLTLDTDIQQWYSPVIHEQKTGNCWLPLY